MQSALAEMFQFVVIVLFVDSVAMSKQAKPRPQFIAHFAPAVMNEMNRPSTINTFAAKESDLEHTATPPQHLIKSGLI